MAEGYVKILSSILDSSIWEEPDDTLRVWLTMLAMADRDGYVGASLKGIARRAKTVSPERVAECLELFQLPDTDSRSEEFEGRRIQKVDRGWLVLNYKKIRDMHGDETEKARKRAWWNTHRGATARHASLDASKSSSASETSSNGSVVVSDSDSENSDARAKSKRDPMGAQLKGELPGQNPDVARLHAVWREVYPQFRNARLGHPDGRVAMSVSDALTIYGADQVERVIRASVNDDWVTGKSDKKGERHDQLPYILSETTFARILASADESETNAKRRAEREARARACEEEREKRDRERETRKRPAVTIPQSRPTINPASLFASVPKPTKSAAPSRPMTPEEIDRALEST